MAKLNDLNDTNSTKWDIYGRTQFVGGQHEPDPKETPANAALRSSFMATFAQFLPPPARVLAPGALTEALYLAQAGYLVDVPQIGVENIEWLDRRRQALGRPDAVVVREMDAHDLTYDSNIFDGYFSCQFHEHLLSWCVHLGEVRRSLRDGAIAFVDACGTPASNPANDLVCHVNLVPAETVAAQWAYWGFVERWRGPHGDDRPQFVFEKLPWSDPRFKHSAKLRRIHDMLASDKP